MVHYDVSKTKPAAWGSQEGVQVDHAEDAVMAFGLQVGELLQGAEIIAKVQVPGRLDAGKNALGAGIGGGRVCHDPGRLACLISAAKPAGGR